MHHAFLIVSIICFGLAALPQGREYPLVAIGLGFLAAAFL